MNKNTVNQQIFYQKMQLSSLLSFCKYPSTISKKSEIPQDFFSKLILLEEKFYQKQLDIQTLDSLIQSYKKLVEIYKLMKDPIESYFIEKIKFILSRPSIIKLILQNNLKASVFYDGMKYENLYMNSSMSIDSSINLGQKTPSFPSIRDSESEIQIQRKRQLERSVQVKIQVELEHNKNDQVCGLKEIFQNYEMQQIRVDEEIAKQTKDLNNKLKQRLKSQDRKCKRELKKQGHSSPTLSTKPFDENDNTQSGESEKITLTSQIIFNPNYNETRQSIQNTMSNIQNTKSQ